MKHRRMTAAAILAAAAMTLGIVSAPVSAAHVETAVTAQAAATYGDLTYEYNASGITIVEYTGTEASMLIIPEKINGTPVTALGEYCLAAHDELSKVTIPDSVTTIGEFAFGACTKLEQVDIPETVTNIGQGALMLCPSLKSVKLPSKLTTIEAGTFFASSALETVNLPAGLTSIEEEAFAATALKDVTLPAGLKTIGEAAFAFCCFDTITIPASVTTIGESAFGACLSLTEISVASGNTACKAVDGVLLTKDGKTLLQYPSARPGVAYMVPDGVEIIGMASFFANTELKEITLPVSLKSVHDSAFSDIRSTEGLDLIDGISLLALSTLDTLEACPILEKVTYKGTIAQWNKIEIQEFNEALQLSALASGLSPYGDVNYDGVVNASDAAGVLMEAAEIGANGVGSFTSAETKAADIDGGGTISASDASYILRYAAMKGASGDDFDIRTLVK